MGSLHRIVSITLFISNANIFGQKYSEYYQQSENFANFALCEFKICSINLLAHFCLLFIYGEKKLKPDGEKKK